MKIRFSLDETINLLNKRDEFIYNDKHTLSNIHCCLIILIKNNIKSKENSDDLDVLHKFENFLSLNKISPPLVMDMDRLEHCVASAEKRNANKSLDYFFIVSLGTQFF
ncbi:hypothetical protein, partial [Rodentibacter trehalosifermentans]|uniref:hypothetical protein n=1 Tax=Rodentibacter trehalosifermentans TaxID=1908263 RepID=UPI001C4DFD29